MYFNRTSCFVNTCTVYVTQHFVYALLYSYVQGDDELILALSMLFSHLAFRGNFLVPSCKSRDILVALFSTIFQITYLTHLRWLTVPRLEQVDDLAHRFILVRLCLKRLDRLWVTARPMVAAVSALESVNHLDRTSSPKEAIVFSPVGSVKVPTSTWL